MKKISIFISIAAFAVMVMSCNKDDKDISKPVIELHEPADGDTIFVGGEVHIEMDLVDDIKLKSYKIEIHSNLDGHDHTKSAKTEGAWSYTKSWDVSGLKSTHVNHHEIKVPATVNGVAIATGDYDLLVYCTDEAGNESYVVRHVEVVTN